VAEKLVPTVPTRLTASELYAALRRIWPTVIEGAAPSRQAIVLMLAHSALETGFWHACWNHNIANAKHVPGDGRDYYAIRHYEIVDGKVEWIDPPADPFASFASLDDGATYYLQKLHSRWHDAWPYLLDGDARGFVHALKAAGYFTAPEAEYAAGVFRCLHQLDATIPPDTVPDLAVVAHAAMAEADNDLDETAHDAPPPPESERT